MALDLAPSETGNTFVSGVGTLLCLKIFIVIICLFVSFNNFNTFAELRSDGSHLGYENWPVCTVI